MNGLINQFLKSTYTKNQALRRMRLIKELLNLLLFESNTEPFKAVFDKFKANYSQYFTGQAGLEGDLIFIENLGENFFKNFNHTNINEMLISLEEGSLHSKLVTVNVPFELGEEESNKMGMWFKQNLGEGALFEVSYDPELIGGCSISYNGIQRDYSLRAKISENKQKILEELSSYK